MAFGSQTAVQAAQAAAASVAKSLSAKGGARTRRRHRGGDGSVSDAISSIMKPTPAMKGGNIIPTFPKITIGGRRRTISKVHKKSLKSLSKKLRKIASTASKAASAAQTASKAKAASQSLSRAMTQTKSLQAQAQQGLQKALSVGRSIGRV
jgi:hypothetical protein